MSKGEVVKVPEKLALEPDGQGNPPEVVTGMLALMNVADEVVLLHEPVNVATAEMSVQVWPRGLVVIVKCGGRGHLIMSGVGHNSSGSPCAVTVAPKENPKETNVHPVKIGSCMGTQTGTPGGVGLAVVPFTNELVQVTVAVPILKLTFLDKAVKVVDGKMVSAIASWLLARITTASAGAIR